MKKLFTLLWLSIAAFTFKAAAQGTTTCNAEFSVQFLNSSTVKFTPVMADSPAVQHSWSFGDGTPIVHQVVPTHSFALPGTYAVIHTIIRVNPNGVPVCTASFTKQVIIEQPCNLVVDFSSSASPTNPLTVQFTNLSVPLSPTDSVTWIFGDNTSSHDINASHTYAHAGTYTVCLIVKKNLPPTAAPCVKYICKSVVVTAPPCNLVVDFSWHVSTTSPVNLLRIEFVNLSTPLAATDSITWTFGDGSISHDVNPVHIYANAGTYTVCLRVKKNTAAGTTPCVREICKTVVVQSPCNLVVDFSSNSTATNPLIVEFHNLSTPLAPTDSITWTFGDGSISHDVNPVHTYANAGTYNVCLTVKKNSNAGTTPCIRTTCKTITITTPCNLVVEFSWSAAPTNPLMVQFTNLSTPSSPTDSTIWNFGDGTTSIAANPLHTYANAGTYNVCLIVKKNTPGASPCVRYSCKSIVVQAPCTLHADFTWHADSANAQKIYFTNTSTPLSTADSVRWTFGDGTSSNAFNPDHIYAQPGTYTVCLRMQKRGPNGTVINCISEICKTVVVYPTCTLVANFIWQADPSNAQKIFFTNTSAPITTADSIRWTFGDGSSSNAMNPDHTYTQPGTYTVCLRVQKRNTNGGGVYNCVREICKVVVVQPACNFQANWSWHLDSVNVKKVYFTNLTIIPTVTAAVTWSFGDGTTANTWNAVHEYANPGRYYVCLRVEISPNCVRYRCDSITVPVPPPPCNSQSNFTFLRSSTNSQTYTFTPDYQNPAAHYTWTFGDGTGSNSMIATHHYDHAGTYTVCLTVSRGVNCTSTTCKTIIVTGQVNCDSIHVSYTYQRDPFIPNKVYFYANANFPILDQTWTITRVPVGSTPPVILHQNNPVYVFNAIGYYNVCLRAITLGGCIKEYCSVVHIEQVATQCTLQAYPNPATTSVSVSVALTQPDMINVYVYNALNVLVKEKHQQGVIGSNVVTLSVGDLIAGQYTMKVIYGTHNCNSAFQKL